MGLTATVGTLQFIPLSHSNLCIVSQEKLPEPVPNFCVLEKDGSAQAFLMGGIQWEHGNSTCA